MTIGHPTLGAVRRYGKRRPLFCRQRKTKVLNRQLSGPSCDGIIEQALREGVSGFVTGFFKENFINIDWNSVEQLKSLRAKIDRRLNQLVVVVKKEKKNHLSVFESCSKIFNTDISALYEGQNLSEERKFYVYVHCDPFFKLKADTNGKIAFTSSLGINALPFYVGKGEGNRAYDLSRNESHRKKRQFIENSGKSIQVVIVKDGLTEKEALMMESKLIDIFGLTSFSGWLVNLDEGSGNATRKEMYIDDYLNVNKRLKCGMPIQQSRSII